MEHPFSRTELLLGADALRKLSSSRVVVFGIGGVGGYVCEALVRSGVGAFDLIDNDTISLTNLNRQIIATQRTLGRYKTEVMKERMLDINPSVEVRIHNCFFLPENADGFSFVDYDYVVDAVDTVSAKLALIMKARDSRTPVISSMGAGNKLDPGAFQVADIYETRVCPLARVMRRELKKRGVERLKVVYSQEEPIKPREIQPGVQPREVQPGVQLREVQPRVQPREAGAAREPEEIRKRSVPGSVAFVPSAAGLMIAGEVVKDLVSFERKH